MSMKQTMDVDPYRKRQKDDHSHPSGIQENRKSVSGKRKRAEKDGAELLQPTTDKVKYSDGTTEEVYGFDVPVEELGKEFDLAILGTKGTWYDHKVSVSDAQKK